MILSLSLSLYIYIYIYIYPNGPIYVAFPLVKKGQVICPYVASIG